jgi:hypothetical protein
VTTIEQSDVSLNHEKSNSVIQFETGFSMIWANDVVIW